MSIFKKKKYSNILFFKECSSTNDLAKKLLNYYPSGTVVTTDVQTKGKGRGKKVWKSDSYKNIYMSIIYKNSNYKFLNKSKKIKSVAYLSQVVGLCLYDIFSDYIEKNKIVLKWPNDLLLNNKKVSGILIEVVYSNDKVDGFIIGLGINLNTENSFFDDIEIPATSLLVETDLFFKKYEFMQEVNFRICNYLDKWIKEGFEPFVNQWKKVVNISNKKCFYFENHKKFEGIIKEVNKNGYVIERDGSKYQICFDDIEIPDYT